MRKITILLFILLITSFSKILAQIDDKSRSIDEKKGQQIFLDFVGTGNLQNSLSKGDDIQSSAGLGVIFEKYNGENSKIIESLELEALINVASTADVIKAEIDDSNKITNRRDFGSFVLNPLSSKQSFYLNSNVYFTPQTSKNNTYFNRIANYLSGINVRVNSANAIWGNDVDEFNLGVLAIRGGMFYEFLPNNYVRVVTLWSFT